MQLSRYARCEVHNGTCSVVPKVAMMHLAGTPCTAVSSYGLRDFDVAMSFAHFLTWVGIRRKFLEPIIVQENVDEFDRDLLVSLLPEYDWTFSIISPCQFGWPVRRIRQWCVRLCCNGPASPMLMRQDLLATEGSPQNQNAGLPQFAEHLCKHVLFSENMWLGGVLLADTWLFIAFTQISPCSVICLVLCSLNCPKER